MVRHELKWLSIYVLCTWESRGISTGVKDSFWTRDGAEPGLAVPNCFPKSRCGTAPMDYPFPYPHRLLAPAISAPQSSSASAGSATARRSRHCHVGRSAWGHASKDVDVLGIISNCR